MNRARLDHRTDYPRLNPVPTTGALLTVANPTPDESAYTRQKGIPMLNFYDTLSPAWLYVQEHIKPLPFKKRYAALCAALISGDISESSFRRYGPGETE